VRGEVVGGVGVWRGGGGGGGVLEKIGSLKI